MLFVTVAVEGLERAATTAEASAAGTSIVYETSMLPKSPVRSLPALKLKRRADLSNFTVTASTSTPAMSAIPFATAAWARASRRKASTFETVRDRPPATVGVRREGATVADVDLVVFWVDVRSSDVLLVLTDAVEDISVLDVLVVEMVVADAGSTLVLAAALGLELVLDTFDTS